MSRTLSRYAWNMAPLASGIVLVILAGCGSAPAVISDSPPSSTRAPQTTEAPQETDISTTPSRLIRTTTRVPVETSDDESDSSTPSGGQNYSATDDVQGSSLDARYQRVLSDANLVANLLNRYWSAELQRNYGLSFDVPDRFEYYFSTGNGPCGGPRQDLPNNAYYCSLNANEYVAFDVNWFVDYLDRFPGDAATFLILAHEWGHAVQDTWGEQQPGIDTWNPAYARELNADCLAGVFLNDAVDSGAITEEEGDAEAIYQQLFEGGSGEWFNPGDHGTSEQRQKAFSDGLLSDVTYCRTYY